MQELEGIVSRAMRQAAQSLDTAQVPEDVFWYAQQVCLSLSHARLFAAGLPCDRLCMSDSSAEQGHRFAACGCQLYNHR